jgi:hypothetical protein
MFIPVDILPFAPTQKRGAISHERGKTGPVIRTDGDFLERVV